MGQASLEPNRPRATRIIAQFARYGTGHAVARLRHHWWAVALLLAATWGFLWPFSRQPWRGLASWGDPVLQYWSMAWTVHALRTDPTRLWHANIFYPYDYTLAYADHLLGATIPVLPIILVTGNILLAFNLAVLLAYFFSALGGYLLLTDLTGSRLAGIAAAIPCGFAPFMLAQLAHLNVIYAGPIALALWALIRVWRGGGWGWSALLALAISWQAAASAYLFYAQAIALGTGLLYLVLAERGRFARRAWLRLAGGLACGGLLTILILWPYLQITRAFGSVRTFDEMLQWSALPRYYLGVTSGNFTWADILRRWSGGNAERSLFPGLVAPLLAVVGLALSRRRERWLFGALVAVGFLLTLGPHTEIGPWRVPLPYALLYRLVPGFSGMRVPTRFVVLVILGLGGLAGLGIEALLNRWHAHGAPRRRKAAAGKEPRPAAATGRGAAWATGSRRTILGVACLALLLGAYTIDYRSRTGMTGPPAAVYAAPAYGWLAAHGTGPVAELPYPPPDKPEAFPNLISIAHWRPIIGGYSGFEPPLFDEMVAGVNTFPAPQAIELLQGLDVEHVVIHRANLSAEQRAALDRGLASEPRAVEVARFGDDVVYSLAPDPWLRRLAATVPPGEAVMFPELGSASLRLELLATHLRQSGHPLLGSGAISYHTFAPPGEGRLPTTAALPADADPALYGWLPGEATLSLGGLTLYRRAPTVRDAVLLNDQALPRATCLRCPALGLRLADGRISTIDAAQANGEVGGGERRSALVAFVNPSPGALTIHAGGSSRQVQAPAGLILYRTEPLATPATVRIEPSSGGTLTPRWVRLDADPGATAGILAARPVALLAGRLTSGADGRMALDLTILPGAGDSSAAYGLSLDIYRRPYGTHPNGHYGYWTIAIPADDRPHRVTLDFAIAQRAADGTIDSAWTPIASWIGPPDSGPLRATLVLSRGETIIGSVPAFEFELLDWQARYLRTTLPDDLIVFFPVGR